MENDKQILEETAEFLKVLAHPVRLCIVRRLWREGARNVTYMQECLQAPQSTISQHLAKLRQAGIIKGERNGLEVVYSLKDERVEEILSIFFEKS
ncbi:MAG: winged helix-turn-helix transcriptional regulator [Selenomonadaceae bacterium]|nr:winged helix-turn-helix transcriptional regulator [Selenomonadaceae bacterium]